MEIKRLKQDKMTATERFDALLRGKPIDRVPFLPFDMTCGSAGFCALNVGYPLSSIYDEPEKSFWAQVWTKEQYRLNSNPIFGYGSYGGWEFGGEIKFPTDRGQAPSIIRHPVESEDDIDKLVLPDVKTAGMLPMAMQFARMQEQHGLPIILSSASPFTCTGNIANLGKLTRWTIKKPQLVHQLLRLATDHIVQVAQYWVRIFGPERIIYRDILPTEANLILSPKQFEEYAFPYLKETHEKVLAMGIKHCSSHICGEHKLNLPLLAQIPMGDPGIVSFGHELNISTAIKYFGDNCLIAGNIEPLAIYTETPMQIYELAKQCIEEGKDAPRGYILAPGCDIPPMVPPYSIYVITKAVDDFGWY